MNGILKRISIFNTYYVMKEFSTIILILSTLLFFIGLYLITRILAGADPVYLIMGLLCNGIGIGLLLIGRTLKKKFKI